jgi:hypothetical protein
MQNTMSKMGVLNKALKILPATEEDIILTGIVSQIAERITELKKAGRGPIRKYESFENLENKIKEKGVPPDDHATYNDLLEWRAIRSELEELTFLLESI